MKINTPLPPSFLRFLFSSVIIIGSAFSSLTNAQIITTIAGNGTAQTKTSINFNPTIEIAANGKCNSRWYFFHGSERKYIFPIPNKI